MTSADKPSSSGGEEKRRAPRVAVMLPAHCRVGQRHQREMLSALSLGGFFLKTQDRVAPGTVVRAALALPLLDGLRFCTLVGSVVRVEEGTDGSVQGLGVALQPDLDRCDRDLLTGFISLWRSARASS